MTNHPASAEVAEASGEQSSGASRLNPAADGDDALTVLNGDPVKKAFLYKKDVDELFKLS